MTAVGLRLRSLWRQHWRAWIVLAVVFGIAGGAAMALTIGVRRTQRAWPQFAAAQRSADVVLAGASGFGLAGAVDLDDVEKTPYIESSARAFAMLPFTGRTDDGRELGLADLFPVASTDTHLGDVVDKWKMLSGRAANPNRPNEATASFVLAERLHLHVGSEIDLQFYSERTFSQVAIRLIQEWPKRIQRRHQPNDLAAQRADGPSVHVRIVGIEASPLEFPPLITDLAPILHLTPALEHRLHGKVVGSPIAYLRLARGYELHSFQLAVERMAAGKPVSFIITRENQNEKVQRSVHAEAIALAIVAALAAFAGLVTVAQSLTRQTLVEASEDPLLRTLGMNDRQLRAVALRRSLIIAAAGSVLACVVAVFGSELALLGLARRADLHIGPHVDLLVLILGSAIIIAVGAIVGLAAARVAQRETRRNVGGVDRGPESLRGPRLAGSATRELPLVPSLGVRFALQRGRPPRAAPAWTAVVGTALTVAMLGFAFTFVANLHRELSQPHRFGWNWDVKLGAPALPDLSPVFAPVLKSDPDVAALSTATVTQLDISGKRIDVIGVQYTSGVVIPTIVHGRAPQAADEVALGARSMRALSVHLGDFVTARIGLRNATLRIVGTAIFPEFGDAAQLGTGALMTYEGVNRLLPNAPRNTFLLRFKIGDNVSRERALLAHAVEPMPSRADARPGDLVNLARGDGLLVLLGLLLAVLAFVMLAHVLVTAVTSRRRDFAVLRSLGMARPQVCGTVACHMAALVSAALVIGLPLGLLAGRWTWAAFATRLGLVADPMLPGKPVLLAIVGAALVGLLAAVTPAWLATHQRPDEVLHAD
jgi:hypothetical protein